MKTYRGNGSIAPLILNLETEWRGVVCLMPRPIYPRESASSSHLVAGCVGPWDGLDVVEGLNLLLVLRLEHRSSSP
jgi:hypothetical protein